MAVNRPTLRVRGAGARAMIDGIRALANQELLVGYPASTTDRPADDEGKGDEITNAAIAYINENGDPELNLPARPHLGPAVAEKQQEAVDGLIVAAKRAAAGAGPEAITQGFHRVGAMLVAAVRAKITSGLEPPLADATLLQRDARRKTGSPVARKEMERRAQGLPPSTQYAKPLIDTGKLLKASNYVIRDKSERSS